jgi:hypothetical protein
MSLDGSYSCVGRVACGDWRACRGEAEVRQRSGGGSCEDLR